MNKKKSAIVLIGYQNDYFSKKGSLHSVIETDASRILNNTLDLIENVKSEDVLIISTPIYFKETYEELKDPVGILKVIKDVGAFKYGTEGANAIPEFSKYKDRIIEVPGKRGLNAFSNTELESVLKKHQIQNVILSGVVTSICIDSTGRSAHERGYKIFILKDCTGARSDIEQDFYFENIFPLYSEVINYQDVIDIFKGKSK
ncbi:MAG: cysteine hydrolase [Candidatus Margulisbacteria bacterium]|nr:cysteine hydrolase [Candidatus Margulisiibacteriota bacterium]